MLIRLEPQLLLFKPWDSHPSLYTERAVGSGWPPGRLTFQVLDQQGNLQLPHVSHGGRDAVAQGAQEVEHGYPAALPLVGGRHQHLEGIKPAAGFCLGWAAPGTSLPERRGETRSRGPSPPRASMDRGLASRVHTKRRTSAHCPGDASRLLKGRARASEGMSKHAVPGAFPREGRQGPGEPCRAQRLAPSSLSGLWELGAQRRSATGRGLSKAEAQPRGATHQETGEQLLRCRQVH